MNAKVLEAIENLREVLSKEMNFHPQTIELASYDHYQETKDPSIPLDLAVMHRFKTSKIANGRHVTKTEHRIPYTNTTVELKHFFDKKEIEYTVDDLPKEDVEAVCESCGEGPLESGIEICDSCYEEFKQAHKHQETEYRNSKI